MQLNEMIFLPAETLTFVQHLRSLAIRALAKMYLPAERLFAFRIRRDDRNTRQNNLEGISYRYTATALIGLFGESPENVTEIFKNTSAHDVCGHVLSNTENTNDIYLMRKKIFSKK